MLSERPRLFLSFSNATSLGEAFPPVDPDHIGHAIRHIGAVVRERNVFLLSRTPVQEYGVPGLSEQNFLLLNSETNLSTILNRYTPSATFYAGGSHDTLEDYEFLVRAPDVLSVPLPITGGAARLIDQWQRMDNKIPAILQIVMNRGNGDAERIMRTVNTLCIRRTAHDLKALRF